ncbi:MAG: ketoacyl-ACP synthase III [Halanaerobiales bacterium]
MNILSKSRIVGIGSYVPERKLTNHDLEKMVDTSDEWIVRRTGVRERHIATEEEYTSDLAVKAVENLIEKANIDVDDVDMVIVTTFTPDHLTPSVASLVQGYFAFSNAGTMDMNAACTGFAYGLMVADSLISAGHSKKVLVIASEAVSKVVDYTDRSTCILFGDAAVAVLLERTEKKGTILGSYFTSDGSLAEYATCSNLSNIINERELEKQRLFQQEGRLLYEYVLKNIPEGVKELLNRTNLSLQDIDWFVPHSANLRMIEAICKRMDFPVDKALVSNELYGNTSSASIPLAIWMGLEEGKVKSGDKLLLYGFGAGLTHGGVIIEC